MQNRVALILPGYHRRDWKDDEETEGRGEDVLLKKSLGENYRFYKTLDDMRRMEGIHARMPFDMYIE